jgi:hypothetical protein
MRALVVGMVALPLLAGCGNEIEHSLHGMETSACSKYRYHIEGAKQADKQEAVDATRALIERLDGEGWELVSFMESGTDELLFAFRKPC